MDIPAEMIERASKQVVGQMTPDKLTDHFIIVHHQLTRLRAGLAVATITGRAIILPPFICQLDKYWGPLHDGGS